MIERRYAEFRADGGAVTGVVMPYGVASTIGRFTETFLAGAFNPLGDEIRANLQHVRSRPLARNVQGGGLVLQDSEIELRAALELPGTETGREARELIERRVLTGFSAEFNVKPGGESWRGTDRTIRAATLHAISPWWTHRRTSAHKSIWNGAGANTAASLPNCGKTPRAGYRRCGA